MARTTDSDHRPRFTPETRMKDAIAADPNLPVVLMRFHVGGCSLCGFEEDDTIAAVAADNGIPLPRLLAALNGDPQEGDPHNGDEEEE